MSTCQNKEYLISVFGQELLDAIYCVEQGILQKIESLRKGESQDDYALVDFVLAKLLYFWKTTYPEEKPLDPLDSKPIHMMDIFSLCKGNWFLAAKFGARDEIEEMLAAEIALDQIESTTGKTALHYAAQNNDGNLVKILLGRGAKILADQGENIPQDLCTDPEVRALFGREYPKDSIARMKVAYRFTKMFESKGKLPGFNISTLTVGRHYGATCEHGAVQIWDLSTGKCVKDLRHGYSYQKHAQSSKLLTFFSDFPSEIYDLNEPALNPIRVEAHIWGIYAFEPHYDRIIARLTKPKDPPEVGVIQLSTGKVVQRFRGMGPFHKVYPGIYPKMDPEIKEELKNLMFITTGGRTGSYQMEIWDIEKGEKVKAISFPQPNPSVAVDENYCALAYPRSVEVINWKTGESLLKISLEMKAVPGVSTTRFRTGRVITHIRPVFGNDRLFQVSNGKLICPYRFYSEWNKEYGIWDISSGKLCGTMTNISHGSNFVKDGKVVLTAGYPRYTEIKVFDLKENRLLGPFPVEGQQIYKVDIIDGILIAKLANAFKFWDLETGQCLQTISSDDSHFFSIESNLLSTFSKRDLHFQVWKLGKED